MNCNWGEPLLIPEVKKWSLFFSKIISSLVVIFYLVLQIPTFIGRTSLLCNLTGCLILEQQVAGACFVLISNIFSLTRRKLFFSPLQLDHPCTLQKPQCPVWLRILSTNTYLCQAFVWRPEQECHMIHRKQSSNLAYSHVMHHNLSCVFCVLIKNIFFLCFD